MPPLEAIQHLPEPFIDITNGFEDIRVDRFKWDTLYLGRTYPPCMCWSLCPFHFGGTRMYGFT